MDQLMNTLSKLADIETAAESFINYGEFDQLSACLNDPAYDELWTLRFPVSDKYKLWNLSSLDPESQASLIRPYSQTGFRCGRKSPIASAPCVSLVYACRGTIECNYQDEYFTVQEKELCVINSGTIINFSSTLEDGFFVSIFFNKIFLNNQLLNRFPRNSRFTPFFEQALFGANHGMDYLIFSLDNSPRIMSYLQALIESFLFQPKCHEEMESSLMFLIICELLALWENVQSPRQPKSTTLEAYDIINYISVNYRDVTLSSISEHFHFHPDTMRKMIKTVMHKNFVDIVQDVRLTMACEQLRKTDLPISRIIQECGYSNISHFYTLFKDRYHCSPAQYRAVKRGDQ